MNNLVHAIAHTWKDQDMTVEIFFSDHKAVKHMSELISDVFRLPEEYETPKDYLQEYYDYMDTEEKEVDMVVGLKTEDQRP